MTAIVPGALLGRGKEAEVFEVADDPSQVIKIYKQPLTRDNRRRLDFIIAARSPTLDAVCAWPSRLLAVNGGDALVMPFASGRQIHEVFDAASRRQAFPASDWTFAVGVARSFAEAVATVHAHGFMLVDISETNAIVDAAGRVRLIDCDSYVTARGGLDPVNDIGTPKYIAPELKAAKLARVTRTESLDNYSLAVLIFKVLFQGSDPMLAEDPSKPTPDWPTFAFQRGRTFPDRPRREELTLADVSHEIADLFEQAFARPTPHVTDAWSTLHGGGAGAAPIVRPTAAAWAGALRRMAQEMGYCRSGPLHTYLAADGRTCPWCARAAIRPELDVFQQVAQVAPPPPARPFGPAGPTAARPEPRPWWRSAQPAAAAVAFLAAASIVVAVGGRLWNAVAPGRRAAPTYSSSSVAPTASHPGMAAGPPASAATAIQAPPAAAQGGQPGETGFEAASGAKDTGGVDAQASDAADRTSPGRPPTPSTAAGAAPSSVVAAPAPPSLKLPSASDAPPNELADVSQQYAATRALACNHTATPILLAAIHMPVGEKLFWTGAGHWRLDPGQCRTLFNTQNHVYYLLAQKVVGDDLKPLATDAPVQKLCTINDRPFSIRLSPKFQSCPEPTEPALYGVVRVSPGSDEWRTDFQ